jgi:HSP20 family protein
MTMADQRVLGVTPAQVKAAQQLVKEAESAGRPVPNALRAIAAATPVSSETTESRESSSLAPPAEWASTPERERDRAEVSTDQTESTAESAQEHQRRKTQTGVTEHHGAWLAWADDRMFRDTLREYLAEGARRPSLAHQISVEERLEEDTYVIRAELPGVNPDEDIGITIWNRVLEISAQRKEPPKAERPSVYYSDFHYGSFQHKARLPEGATEADITASYKDGILEVRIPVPSGTSTTPTNVGIEHTLHLTPDEQEEMGGSARRR